MKKSITRESFLNRPIVLIGMMGAGKSSIGAALARLAARPFFDSDHEIEAAAGMPVPRIFADYGEAEFRRMERQVIARLLTAEPCVLSLGGGAFIDPDTRANVKNAALSVWLRVDYDILLRRVLRHGDRPLLKDGDPARKLADLLTVRAPLYAQADLTVECDDRPIEDTAARVWASIAAEAGA